MAYIGLSPVTNFLTTFSETFSGNNSDVQFIMSKSVGRAEDLEVFVDGDRILPDQYRASGRELTFINSYTPGTGTDNITVIFRAGALQTIAIEQTGYPAGSASSPSIYYTDATNTGLFFPTTTKVSVVTGGTTRATFDAAINSTSTTTGALQVTGGMGVTANLYAGGITRFTNATESTSASTGAMVVSGGVGVAKNLNVDGDVQITGDFTVGGTFTTTASDALVLNDPFVFLADGNSGDSQDIGFVGEYNDGTNTRYTGMFRDITDGKFKVFANLLVQPTTTVDTANVSFALASFSAGAIQSSGQLTATAGTAASSTTTGALVVTGGIGASGAIYAASLDLGSGAIATTGAVGNVASVTASGVIQTTGIVYANANVTATTSATGALRVKGGIGVTGNIVVGENIQGTLSTAYQPAITAVGTLTNGTWQGNTIQPAYGGTGITSLGAGVATFLGTPSADNLRSAVTSDTGTGALVFGTSPTFTTQITTPAIVKSGTDGVGNIGQSGNGFNTVHAKATSAQYADLAEKYTADADYEPGTVLHFGGDKEVAQCDVDHCTRVAGVVSTAPAYRMNDGLEAEHTAMVALVGRVPCKVQGPVAKGDMMVSAGNGMARAEANPKVGAVIGKALENWEDGEGVIEVVVGKH